MEKVITFGCRLNTYESALIKGIIKQAKLKNVAVFNTCSVTKEAEQQAVQAIRKFKRENPDVKIIVTGCAAQLNADKYLAMKEVDQVISNAQKLNVSTYTQADVSTDASCQIPLEFQNKTRALLQIQNGCDNKCSFCIIPYARGKNVSTPIKNIINQARLLVASGHKEIVLTGINITLYGRDFLPKTTLARAIKIILNECPDLPRLRLSSLDISDIDNELLDLMLNEARLMPHFHLSLQSGSNPVLRKMFRKHTREQALDLCKTLQQRPDVALGADIIAGFPTETTEMFEETKAFLEEARIPYLHVFPYSERPGTPAASLPQLNKKIRKDRAKILREVGQKVLDDFSSKYVGRQLQLLMEGGSVGRAANFLKVHLPNSKTKAGKIVNVIIDGYENQKLIAHGSKISKEVA